MQQPLLFPVHHTKLNNSNLLQMFFFTSAKSIQNNFIHGKQHQKYLCAMPHITPHKQIPAITKYVKSNNSNALTTISTLWLI